MGIKINKLLSLCMVLILMVGLSSHAIAQRTVSGTVTDAASGEALISATIQVKGTAVGTTTDIDGKYSLSVPDGSTTLVFTYIGYAAKEVELGADNTVDAQLSEGLDITEVVVTGYGVQQKGEVTSSVVSIKSEDFNQGNVHSPTQLVQGKVAGLSISTVGNDPNSNASIRLRGLATLGANTSPLIVIDGVIGGSLETVDPNDIASIDVLKDGSAAAIYGTRASSGVIIVTTKKGRAGKTTVDYNVYGTTETIARRVQTLNASEFAALRPNTNRGASTDWVDLVTRDAFTHVHNISMSGGVNNTTYRASLNYRDVQGIAAESGFQQLNGRLNLSQKTLNDRLTLDLNISATSRDAEFGYVESLRYATLYNPTAPTNITDETNPLFDQFGGYYQEINFDYFNPLAIVDQTENVGELKDLVISGKATLEITEGLKASAFVAQQTESDLTGQFIQKQSFWGGGTDRNGLARRFTEDRTNDLFEATLTYDNNFDGLKLNALVGYSWQENTIQNFFVEAGDFLSDDISFNNLEDAQDFPNALATVNSQKETNRVIGFFGRVNLAYDDTYFFSASVRREGSSRFGANNKWGTFPALSAGVNLSNLLEAEDVDQLKLRIGYGQTGAIPPESYLSLLRFTGGSAFFFNGGYVPAFSPNRNSNPDLKWEIKEEFNVGLDFAFLDYKLSGSIEYYDRTTSDLIFNVPVPVPPNQADRTWANLEDVTLDNSGVELTLTYNYSKSDFSWEPTVTFGTYSTTINKIDVADATFAFFQGGDDFIDFSTSPGAPGLNNNPTMIVRANEEIGLHYGPVFNSISADGTAWVFEDLNGDGTTDANGDQIVDAEDMQVIGNALPDFSLGFQNTLRYKDLDITVFFRGDFGHDMSNMYRVFYEPLGTGSREIENIVQTEYFLPNANVAPQFSSYYVEDASFVTLENLTVGYSINPGEESGFSKVRFYVTGRNLFYITDYTGVTPEVRYTDFNTGNPLFPGIDRRNTYFRTRSFSIGANITLR